jgi:uncharacterized membrane protein YdjX (TVP38/TMEM64 family)
MVRSSRKSFQWLAVVILGLALALLYWRSQDGVSWEFLAAQEERLHVIHQQHPWLLAFTAALLYALITGLAPGSATLLSLTYAWFFKFWWGLLIISFGSTLGAFIAFSLSRYLLRDWVQERLRDRWQVVNQAFEREGAFYLLTLRLTPIVPFFLINPLMGLTRIRATTFWWASQVGMLPGTIAYVNAGAALPSLQHLAEHGPGKIISWQLLLAFALLGVLPLILKRVVDAWRAQRQPCKH